MPKQKLLIYETLTFYDKGNTRDSTHEEGWVRAWTARGALRKAIRRAQDEGKIKESLHWAGGLYSAHVFETTTQASLRFYEKDMVGKGRLIARWLSPEAARKKHPSEVHGSRLRPLHAPSHSSEPLVQVFR